MLANLECDYIKCVQIGLSEDLTGPVQSRYPFFFYKISKHVKTRSHGSLEDDW